MASGDDFAFWVVAKTRGPEPISLVFLLGSSRGKARSDRNIFFPTTTKSQDMEAQTGRGTSQNRWNKNMFVNLTGL